MPESLENAVCLAVVRVLETAAFMTVWPCQESDGELAHPDVAATMTFCGPRTGRLTLYVASEVLPLLTQNMLGELEPDDSPEEQRRDAVKEMLNMICGNLLTEWQGAEPVFNLSPPEIVNARSVATSAEKCVTKVRFNLENTLAVVEVEEKG